MKGLIHSRTATPEAVSDPTVRERLPPPDLAMRRDAAMLAGQVNVHDYLLVSSFGPASGAGGWELNCAVAMVQIASMIAILAEICALRMTCSVHTFDRECICPPSMFPPFDDELLQVGHKLRFATPSCEVNRDTPFLFVAFSVATVLHN